MAQQWYTITADGTYGQRRWYVGDQIPMEWAVAWGLSGAALTEPDFFSSDEQAAIRALLADPFDVVESMQGDDATAQQTITAQRAYLQAVWVSVAKTVTKLSVYTTATGTNLDLAILDAAGTRAAGLAAPAASVANGATTGTLTAAFTYEPGVIYYHTVVGNATTTGLRGASSTSAVANPGTVVRAALKDIAQNTIPTTITGVTPTATRIWIAAHN